MKHLVQRYLTTVPHKIGETVQLGWFTFRIASDSEPPEIESLDFRAMASFTTDFSAVERVRDQQWQTLCRCSVQEEPCSLAQAALVSRSYRPGATNAFLERQSASNDRDSGWYVGVLDDPRDMSDERSFEFRSLYELSIADERMIPFWLLPVGKKVMLDSAEVL
ncbi:MAG: immunity protein Imm33 domain-containing protein [Verrucomicrobiota bacterium]